MFGVDIELAPHSVAKAGVVFDFGAQREQPELDSNECGASAAPASSLARQHLLPLPQWQGYERRGATLARHSLPNKRLESSVASPNAANSSSRSTSPSPSRSRPARHACAASLSRAPDAFCSELDIPPLVALDACQRDTSQLFPKQFGPLASSLMCLA